MWEGKPWDPWQDMVLGGILGGALRPALSNLPSPSLGGSGSGNPSANAGTIGVPTVTGADTSGGTSTGPAGGNAPSTQSNAPQPGVGSGGGGSQPAGGNGVNVPDNSAPQPGVGNGGSSQPAGGGAPPIDNSAPQPGAGDGGGSQPAPSNAPEVPSGDVPSPAGDAPAAPPADVPAAPPADAPAAPPADGPAAPPADGPVAPPADAPAAPPADAPAAPPADGPVTPPAEAPAAPPAEAPAAPPADGPAADASTTDAPSSDVPAADAPGSDAPPADGTTSDAFGIPVVDLPNLPDALPSSAPSGPESPSSTGDASTTDASSDAPQAAGPLPASTPATVSPSQPAADADAPSASEAPSDAPDQDGAFPPASDAADAADAAPAEAEGPAPADADGDGSDAPIDIEDAAAVAGGSAAFVAAGTVASGRLPNLFDTGRPAPDGTASEADGSTSDPDRGGDPDDASSVADDTSTGDSDATADEPTLRGNEPTTLTIDEIRERMAEINPNFDATDPANEFTQNCGDTSSILNDVLNGGPVRQAGTDTLSIEQMRARTGFEQTSMTPTEIADTLRRMGAGSHAVVGVDRAGGQDGHWFNVYFDGTDVWTLDAQTNEIGGFPPHEPDAIHWDVSIEVERPDTSDASATGSTEPANEFDAAERERAGRVSDAVAAGTDPTGNGKSGVPGMWQRVDDILPRPGYGQPLPHPGSSPSLSLPPASDPANVPPLTGFDLLADRDAPYGAFGTDQASFDRHDVDANSGVVYPPNAGAVSGSRVLFTNMRSLIRHYGAGLDRIGSEYGEFLGLRVDGQPATTEERALPPSSLEKPYYSYSLAQVPLPPGIAVEVSRIEAALGQPGGGMQLVFRDTTTTNSDHPDGVPLSIRELKRMGLIK